METTHTAPAMQPQGTQPERNVTSYEVSGLEVKLTIDYVKKYIARGVAELTDEEAYSFIGFCKYNCLNPFLNEAFLIKYKKGDAPTYIVGKYAFMKRAEACPDFDGFEAGLILKRGDMIVEEVGSLMLPGDTLLGGWSKAYRKSCKYPFVARVALSEYSTGQALWASKPSTMIRKVAIVHALREAFPTQLGGLYVSEEMPEPEDATYEDVTQRLEREKAAEANRTTLSIDNPPATGHTPQVSADATAPATAVPF
jgi:hypothetical protein